MQSPLLTGTVRPVHGGALVGQETEGEESTSVLRGYQEMLSV